MSNLNVLTSDQIFKAAPAAFATTQDSKLSSRYSPASTVEVLANLDAAGYKPVFAHQEARAKSGALTTHGKHLLKFVHEDNLTTAKKSVPQIVLLNSHQGNSSLRLMAGQFRFVCANGLIVGDTKAQARFTHTGKLQDFIGGFATEFAARASSLSDVLDGWTATQLNGAQVDWFARQALTLRFGPAVNNSFLNRYSVSEATRVVRAEDIANNLWTVFNRVQEHLINGGLAGYAIGTGRRVSSKALTSVAGNTDFNARLWALAAHTFKVLDSRNTATN